MWGEWGRNPGRARARCHGRRPVTFARSSGHAGREVRPRDRPVRRCEDMTAVEGRPMAGSTAERPPVIGAVTGGLPVAEGRSATGVVAEEWPVAGGTTAEGRSA